VLGLVESLGRGTVRGVEGVGHAAMLFAESLYLAILGRRRRQPVRLASVGAQMMQTGIAALPIATLLSGAIGAMLAIQSLYSLGLFGAESFAYVGIALSVAREFSPLIIGILVAGRSGSALAARLGTMTLNQEIDALKVMGIEPVRYLVAPALFGLVVMVPALTVWSMMVALAAAGLYVAAALDITLVAFLSDVATVLTPGDVLHGLGKSAAFAVLIALIGAVNGAATTGGAEGLGRATTRAVVQCISAIVIADMVVAWALAA